MRRSNAVVYIISSEKKIHQLQNTIYSGFLVKVILKIDIKYSSFFNNC